MLTQFHHNGKTGLVTVHVGDHRYEDTYENLVKDLGKKVPVLPPTALERIYDVGQRHVLHDVAGEVIDNEKAAPRDWPLGDQIIKSIFKLKRAQASRIEREHRAPVASAVNARQRQAKAAAKERAKEAKPKKKRV